MKRAVVSPVSRQHSVYGCILQAPPLLSHAGEYIVLVCPSKLAVNLEYLLTPCSLQELFSLTRDL